jgi:hypothetical protein
LNKNRFKLVCLSIFILSVTVILLTGERAVQTAHANASGPPGGRTGAPGELTCATSECHGGAPNTGPGQLEIEGPSVYEPGQTYQIRVAHSTNDGSRRRWGFQLTALAGNNVQAGDMQSINGLTNVLNQAGPGFSRQYIEHDINGTFRRQISGANWSFNWTAPSSDVGPITLYAAGNQANDDGTNSGDQIYTAAKRIFSGPPVIESVEVQGKKLIIRGRNFDIGAAILIGESKQKKTSNDAEDPFSMLVGKKSGKKIARGQTVFIIVRNPDNTTSEVFSFTRPAD